MVLPTDVTTPLLDYSGVRDKPAQGCDVNYKDSYGHIWHKFHKALSYPLS